MVRRGHWQSVSLGLELSLIHIYRLSALKEASVPELIYENDGSDECRFVLGKFGERNLICVGLNPSRAEPGNYDPTMKRVENWASMHGYDGHIMVNLYPQLSLIHIFDNLSLRNDLESCAPYALRLYSLGLLLSAASYVIANAGRIAYYFTIYGCVCFGAMAKHSTKSRSRLLCACLLYTSRCV